MMTRKVVSSSVAAVAGGDFVPVGGEGATLGESPFWDHADCVWWVDIASRRLLRTRLSTRETRAWPTPETPGFVVLTGPGQPVVGMESGVFEFSPADGAFRRVVRFDIGGQRFNDATVDGTGRLWASTLSLDGERGRGAVHVVTPELTLATVVDGLTTPNGLAADHVGGRLFLSDSHPETRMIWTAGCDFAAGDLGPRADFASTAGLAGRPDGAALSDKGAIYWIAGVDGAELYGFGRDGRLGHRVPLPFRAPTKLAFCAGGVAVTAKAEGGYDGRIALAVETLPPLRGPALPFWRPGGRDAIATRT